MDEARRRAVADAARGCAVIGLIAFAVGCGSGVSIEHGMEGPTVSTETESSNAVTCECAVRMPELYAPSCFWAGGQTHDGYCWVVRRQDACLPAELNPGATTAARVAAHVPTDADLDAFCAGAAPTVLSMLDIMTGGCPRGHTCPVSFCAGTTVSCHAARDDSGRVITPPSHPSCDQECPAVPVIFSPQRHPTNINTGATAATYVQASWSCSGADTPLVCLTNR